MKKLAFPAAAAGSAAVFAAAFALALGAGLTLTLSPVSAGQGHDHGSHAGHDHSKHDHSKHDHAAHAGHDHAKGAAVKKAAVTGDAAVIRKQLPSYPLDVCVISGEPLGSMGEPHEFVHEGRLVRMCCPACEKGFAKDPATALAKIDAAVIEAQGPAYPATHCPISGKELGSMGDPYDHVYGTRLVKFCCGGCLPTFKKDPEAAMAKVDEAWIQAQLADYPTDMCPVMDTKNDAMGEPFHILHGTRLVSLCCEKCVEEFEAEPAKYLAKLDEAVKSKK